MAEIETFVAIAELGSFAAVATKRNIAVSAVSRRLNDLELRLGVRLAERSNRGLSLNAEGREYYRQSLKILADIQAMDSSVGSAAVQFSGLIRIAIPRSFGVGYLSPIINEYADRWPGIRFDLNISDAIVDLAEGGYDFAIRIGHQHSGHELTSVKLLPVQHVVSASPAFWMKHGVPKKPSDIEGYPALAYQIGVESTHWKYKHASGRKGSVRLVPRFVSTSGDFLVLAAIDNLGVVLEPTFVCGEAIQQGLLQPVLLEFSWFESDTYLIYQTSKPLNRCAAAFADFLIEKCDKVPSVSALAVDDRSLRR